MYRLGKFIFDLNTSVANIGTVFAEQAHWQLLLQAHWQLRRKKQLMLTQSTLAESTATSASQTIRYQSSMVMILRLRLLGLVW